MGSSIEYHSQAFEPYTSIIKDGWVMGYISEMSEGVLGAGFLKVKEGVSPLTDSERAEIYNTVKFMNGDCNDK